MVTRVYGGYKGLQGLTGGYRGLQGVIRGYKVLEGYKAVIVGYKALHGCFGNKLNSSRQLII